MALERRDEPAATEDRVRVHAHARVLERDEALVVVHGRLVDDHVPWRRAERDEAFDDVPLLEVLERAAREEDVGAVGVLEALGEVEVERAALLRDPAARLDDVFETLAIAPNPIPIKAAMGLLGFDVGAPRLPLVEATGMQVERLRAMLERNELLATHA